MTKFLAAICLVAIAYSASARAAVCNSIPYTLTNGTTASADQVMSNFNYLSSCFNSALAPFAPLASPQFTGVVNIAGSLGVNTTGNPGGILDVRAAANEVASFRPNQLASAGIAIFSVSDSNALQPLELAASKFELAGGNVLVGTTPMSNLMFEVDGSAGGTTAWTNLSDGRLKKNIHEITGALALVERLRGVRYEWRPDSERQVGKGLDLPVGKPQIGFVAQEVADVVPEAAVVPKPGTDAAYGLQESKLVPILVEALKEQQAEIEQLKAAISDLKPKK